MSKHGIQYQNWLWWIGKCAMLFLLVNCVNGAPQQYRPTTEATNPLTTIQYYVKPNRPRPTTDAYDDYEEAKITPRPPYPTLKSEPFSPPELILTLFKTAVDIVRNMNKKKSIVKSKNNSTITPPTSNDNVTSIQLLDKSSESNVSVADSGKRNSSDSPRGMDHEHYTYEDHYPTYLIADHPHDEAPTTTEKPAPVEMMKQSRYTDPWTGYYDFIINEGSFKFWSGFQLFTALLLLYSALAAIYYAKFNPIQPDYDTTYDDYFFGRSLEESAPVPSPTSASPAPGWISSLAGMGAQTYQRVMDTLHSAENKYK